MWTCSVLQNQKSWWMWKAGTRMWMLITEQLFQLVLLPINNSRAETVSTFMRQRAGEILQVSRGSRCERRIYEINLSLCNAPMAMNHLKCIKWDRGDGVSYFWTCSCRRLRPNRLFISLSTEGFCFISSLESSSDATWKSFYMDELHWLTTRMKNTLKFHLRASFFQSTATERPSKITLKR